MSLLKKVTSATAGLAIVFSIVSPIAGVSAAATSLEAANELATLGVIVDQSANPADYRLGDTIDRREMLKVMSNLANLSVTDTCTGEFADLSSSDWGCKYAEAALANGMIAANTNFNPDAKVSKAEGLKMVFTARGLERNANTDWRAGYVEAAVEMGVAASAFTNYDMDADRGQIFVWAVNAIDAGESASEEDDLLGSLLGDLGGDDEDTTEDEATTDPVVTTPVATTGGEVMVSLSPLSPVADFVAANSPRTAILAFDVTAGSSDVSLDEATISYVGLSDYAELDNVALYMDNVRISKSDDGVDFNEIEEDIKIDNDVVVQAGTTKTVVVTATLDGGIDNVSHRVALTDLDTSGTVSGLDVVGNYFNVVSVSNVGELEFDANKVTKDLKVGENSELAGFSLEAGDDEDVTLKALTFTVEGTLDAEDDLTDLSLLADNVEIASGLFVNDDDQVEVTLDYTIDADESVDFELFGTVTAGANQDDVQLFFASEDDVYAVGAATGISIDVADLNDNEELSSLLDIEGALINVSFDKGDADEARPGAEDVVIGTLVLETAGEYTIETIEVLVEGDNAVLETIALGSDDLDGEAGTAVTYEFDDIDLNSETLSLPLTIEVSEEATTEDLEFTITVTEVTDEVEDETYTIDASGENADGKEILSTNEFDNDISVEKAKLTVTYEDRNDRTLVVANDVETVLYSAKLTVSDADSIILQDLDLTQTSATVQDEDGNDVDLDDIFKEVTINIGGQTIDADDITAAGLVEFRDMDITVAAGESNVELVVVASFKDVDVANGEVIEFELDTTSLVVENSEGDEEDDNDVATVELALGGANGTLFTTTLNDRGEFNIEMVTDGEYEDEINSTVLAGESNITLAELEVITDYEDVEVEELEFSIAGDFSSTFEEVRMVLSDGSSYTAESTVFDGTDTIVLFEDIVFMESDNATVDGKIVADIASYSTEGDAVVVNLSAVEVILQTQAANGDGEFDNFVGAESNEELTVVNQTALTAGNGDITNIVPVLVTAVVAQEFDDEEEDAIVTFVVDYGNNDLDDNDVVISTIEFDSAAAVTALSDAANGAEIENENDEVTFTGAGAVITITDEGEISNGDQFTFTVDTQVDGTVVEIIEGGIEFTVDGNTYVVESDNNDLDLGRYTTDNDN